MFKLIARFAHTLAYSTLSGAYTGYCSGLDTGIVGAVAAAVYLLLAVEALCHACAKQEKP